MSTPNERLRTARERAGFESATEAAQSLGIPRATYIGHENGHRGFPASRAPSYARKFGVSEEWLLYGKGKGPSGTEDHHIPSAAQLIEMVELALREIQPGMTLGDMPNVVAPALREKLVEWSSSGGLARRKAEKNQDAEAGGKGEKRRA